MESRTVSSLAAAASADDEPPKVVILARLPAFFGKLFRLPKT
jgi:hypothetical protein